MKKLIFVLCLGVMSMFSGCLGVMHCPNGAWCARNDFCCPDGYPYTCNDRCWSSWANAAWACGAGADIEQCEYE